MANPGNFNPPVKIKNSFQNPKRAAWLSFGEEQGGAEGAILKEACPSATTLLPAQQICHPMGLAGESHRRGVVSRGDRPSGHTPLATRLAATAFLPNDAHFEF
jgi:hypothetical protein